MASPTGGRFLFSPPTGSNAVTLGINLGGGAQVFPTPVVGNFNIEVFTASSVTGSASSLVPDSGFQAAIIDPGTSPPTFLPHGYLRGTTLELGTGNYLVVDYGPSADPTDTTAGAASIVGGSGNQTIYGAVGDVLIGGSGTQVLNSLTRNGGESIFGGSGTTTVYAGPGNVVVGGSGNEYIDGTAGSMAIKAGRAGTETINGSYGNGFSGAAALPDTLTGGAAAVDIQGLGKGDQVNFSDQTGNATINAQAYAFNSVSGLNASVPASVGSNIAITLGGGAATVFGGFGDTINLGSVDQYVDGYTGGQTIHLGGTVIGGTGVVPTDRVFGSNLAGGGDTILAGGGANINFGVQNGGGDLIDLSGSTGSNTVQAFGTFSGGTETDVANVNDTIIAGVGSNTVFGGQGDRIGAGATGNDLFLHSTTIAGAVVGFGSNAPVATANITVGAVDTTPGAGDSVVGGFAYTGTGATAQATDYVFFQTPANFAGIVATATPVTVDTVASTQFTLPDGSTMTLIGVPLTDFNTSFFGP